jgi:hypothetical protein
MTSISDGDRDEDEDEDIITSEFFQNSFMINFTKNYSNV